MRYKYPIRAADAPIHAVYPYVLNWYRSGGTYWDNVKSLWQLHTETINAWTMICASMMSTCASWFAVKRFAERDKMALLVFPCFTLSAVLHLPFSVGYHLFMSMDEHTFNVWRRLDIMAIFNVSILLTFSLPYY